MTTTEEIGSYQHKEVVRYTIRNNYGMEACILNVGGIMSKLMVPDKHGEPGNVVFGFDHFSDYFPNLDHHIGSIVGRYANRIGGASFVIDGKKYFLTPNEGKNTLHGGKENLSKQCWNIASHTYNEMVLNIESPDGDNGFPGKLELKVTISLSDENELILRYDAVSSKDTHVCFTQHSYFNLTGKKDHILDHQLWVNASKITETDNQNIPTGNFTDIASTPYDFEHPRKLDEVLGELPQGIDNNYVINGYINNHIKLNKAAELIHPATGRKMEVFTTEPGLQIYTAQHLHHIQSPYPISKFPAICLEAQHFPDSPNKPEFPSTLLRSTDRYFQETRYRFSIID